MVMSLCVPYKAGNFVTSSVTVSKEDYAPRSYLTTPVVHNNSCHNFSCFMRCSYILFGY
jgi:hypothetical protein